MNSLKLPFIPKGLKPTDWGQLIYGHDTVTVGSPSSWRYCFAPTWRWVSQVAMSLFRGLSFALTPWETACYFAFPPLGPMKHQVHSTISKSDLRLSHTCQHEMLTNCFCLWAVCTVIYLIRNFREILSQRNDLLIKIFFKFLFFLMWTIFKVFNKFVTILLLFYVFWPQGTWDLGLPRWH